jgi:hypothetical protein
MNTSKLKVGDRIRITAVPGEGIPGYTIHKDTVRVYKKIMARKRSVRIREIDEYGSPWYMVKFKKGKKWEYHFMVVAECDTNWVPVKRKVKDDHVSGRGVSI